MRIEGINHVGITTGDITRSKRFYRDVLGLPLRGEGEDSGPELDRLVGLPDAKVRWAEFHLGHDQILELLQYESPRGEALVQRVCDPGSAHLALEVDDLDATYALLVDAGVEVRSPPVALYQDGDWRGFRFLYAVDPDGFTVEFVQRPTRTVVDKEPLV